MTDLVEFYAARLDEDEQLAREVKARWYGGMELYDDDEPARAAFRAFVDRFDEDRVLREVEAKRHRLARHSPTHDPLHGRLCSWCSVEQVSVYREWPCPDIRDDVAVYADHPDYCEEWRP